MTLSTALRYRKKPYFFFYALGKLSLDPAYPVVRRALADSPRPLLDIGCGMGLLAAYLRTAGHRGSIAGLDIDADKIGFADTVLGLENARFSTADALDLPEHSGDVVVLDVLHYFDDQQQRLLLEKIAARLGPGGTAFIRVTLNEPSLRFAFTRFEEWFVHFVRWIPVKGSNFPTRNAVLQPFEAAGFQCLVEPMWGMTPFNSYLITVRR